jgi:hypothetical protein
MNSNFRLEDGSLPSYAFPGGYPLYYVCKDNSVLCPACANKEDIVIIIRVGINFEDPALYCDECSQRIESAYTEDEAFL